MPPMSTHLENSMARCKIPNRSCIPANIPTLRKYQIFYELKANFMTPLKSNAKREDKVRQLKSNNLIAFTMHGDDYGDLMTSFYVYPFHIKRIQCKYVRSYPDIKREDGKLDEQLPRSAFGFHHVKCGVETRNRRICKQ